MTLTSTAPGPALATGKPTRSPTFAMSPGEEIFSLDLPDEPQTMALELRVTGTVDPERLERAIAAALEKHPMSRAQRASRRWLLRAPRWEIADSGSRSRSILQVVEVDDDEALVTLRDDFCSRRPELDQAPAIRILLARRPDGDSLLFNVNHALMDGIGAIRWVNSVARAYAGRPDPAPDVDPITARDLHSMAGDRAARSRSERPARHPRGPVSGICRVIADDRAGFGVTNSKVTAEVLARLDPSFYGPDTTVNDLLVAALHLAIERWNQTQGRRTEWTSVMVPVNLRPAEWINEVASMITFVDRNVASPTERSDPGALVETVTAQMRRVRSGPGFAKILNRAPWARWLIGNAILPMILYIPWAVPRFLKGQVDSMLFANLGRIESKISSFGEGTGRLTGFWASPPVTMPLGAGLDAAFLRGELYLSLRYRRALLDRRAAEEFMTTYLRTLLNLGRVED